MLLHLCIRDATLLCFENSYKKLLFKMYVTIFKTPIDSVAQNILLIIFYTYIYLFNARILYLKTFSMLNHIYSHVSEEWLKIVFLYT